MNNSIRKISHLLCLLAFLSMQTSAASQAIYDLDDVKYQGRYVDLFHTKFYDSDFTITVNLHSSMQIHLNVTAADLQDMASEWNDERAYLKYGRSKKRCR